MDSGEQAALERKAKTGLDYNIIDADAHMAEPPELWQQRVEQRFRDAAPRVLHEHKGQKGMYLAFEDVVVRFAPPGILAERLKALRDAFDATMKDPYYCKDAATTGFDPAPVRGEDQQRLVRQVLATPPDLVARAKEIME